MSVLVDSGLPQRLANPLLMDVGCRGVAGVRPFLAPGCVIGPGRSTAPPSPGAGSDSVMESVVCHSNVGKQSQLRRGRSILT